MDQALTATGWAWDAILGDLRRRLLAAVEAAAADAAWQEAGVPDFAVEVPKERGRGDFATNLALLLAGRIGRPPRQVAEAIAVRLPLDDDGPAPVERCEVAGPGFINIFLKPGWLTRAIPAILAGGRPFGHTSLPLDARQRIQVEFVSANPTGPLNVVNARAAAYGDALARVLQAAGHEVFREYYINDAGNQFEKLGLAMECRARQQLGQDAPLPEGAYPGDYVIDLARACLEGPGGQEARRILEDAAADPQAVRQLRGHLARFAVEQIVTGQRATLARYGVRYDNWYPESSVRQAGGPARALNLLKERGHLYEAEGALWFRTTAFGDDQDRVLVRQNGEMTYFLADIAYHLTKFERRFQRVIDIWGQDHHGYVARMQAAMVALGYPAGCLEVLLTQMVRLMRGGEAVKISKRGGEFVTMDEFLDDVGPDAARFFFLMRSMESHMDFDLDLAIQETQENPVYYVQYAHARIASILRQAREQSGPQAEERLDWRQADLALLSGQAEEDLLRKMAAFPGEVASAAARREPHRLTVYARELATLFHTFYVQCRVLGEDASLSAARLALIAAARQVLANCLDLLGVSAPERM